jgi:hypothetical protein
MRMKMVMMLEILKEEVFVLIAMMMVLMLMEIGYMEYPHFSDAVAEGGVGAASAVAAAVGMVVYLAKAIFPQTQVFVAVV